MDIKDLINEVRSRDCERLQNILDNITGWLEDELAVSRDIADAKDNKGEFHYESTDDIIYGRRECATGLLNQIKNWESEEEKQMYIDLEKLRGN
tara:strand:+ start:4245 stop:4526 length:282 start_codon:yes stop_codon:yes gene_type:complete